MPTAGANDTPREYAGQPCQNCGLRLPARRDMRPFSADAIAERSRLAMLDPEGEHDSIGPLPRRYNWATGWEPERIGWRDGAVRPLDGVRARAILLHLAEPEPARVGKLPTLPNRSELDQRAILERLGCDLSRTSGVVRCPGPLHANGDRRPSLSWRWTGERALVHCNVGCSFQEIRAAV